MCSMPTLHEQLRADIVTAMKARDSVTLTSLRTADAAIKKAAMDVNKDIDDALCVATLRKAVKNLADAAADFEKSGRTDLVEANRTEMALLEKYLPAGLDAAKLTALVDEAVASTGAVSPRDMGKVMGVLKKHPDAGLIDFGVVSKLLQERLK